MKIIIAGAGEVGSHLAKMLSGGPHDVTVIDEEQKLLDDISDQADVITIEGDPTTFAALKKASVRKTDLFIGVSPDENLNIIAAVLAKQLGARRSIARIDNNEYLEPNNKEIFLNMGIDHLFYPEKAAAREVIDLLGHTYTTEYVDFSGGRLALVVMKLDATSPLTGHTLIEMTRDRNNLEFRTVAISRNGITLIPRGDDRFQADDTIYVITDNTSVRSLTELSGKRNQQVRSLIILGGSRIGVRIAMELENEINVKLVEYNEEKAYRLAEQLDHTLIINEDGRDIDALLDEGLEGTDAFVAVTGRSETNILAAMLAKKTGVKKVIAEVENLNFINLAESVGIDTIINKKLITASDIFTFTMNTDIQSVKYLTGSQAEVLEFIVKPDSPATRTNVMNLDFPSDAIIGGVVRNNDMVFIATGKTEILPNDRVVVFALPGARERVARFFN